MSDLCLRPEDAVKTKDIFGEWEQGEDQIDSSLNEKWVRLSRLLEAKKELKKKLCRYMPHGEVCNSCNCCKKIDEVLGGVEK